MASIVLEGVTKRFPDGTEAVKETTFTIEDGEFFILVGPSGCGKSTMLNMIVGLEDLTAGKLRVGDDIVNDVDPKDRNMAMVFQTYAIYPHMTVRENIAFPLRLAKMPQDEIDRRVQEAAEILELSEQLDKKPASLSGGQRQRVAMGRAIVREPVAFLMDEPLSNLDAKLRVQMRTELTRLHQRLETTTVYVTHDQTEAMTLGDWIAVMREGEVQQIGTPRDLYLEPTNLFVAGFIGSPSMNFLPAGRDGDTIKLPMVEFTLSDEQRDQLPDEDRRLIAGIRPEHFEDAALVGDAGNGVTFTVTVDVVEWMGNEIFAYFDVEAEVSDELRALAAELENPEMAAGEGIPAVAALDAASDVREQSELELWLDTAHVQLFDAETGQNLTVASARSEQRAGSA